MRKLFYGVAAIAAFSATALHAQNTDGAAGAELYVVADGANPWPEMGHSVPVSTATAAIGYSDTQTGEPYQGDENGSEYPDSNDLQDEPVDIHEVPLNVPDGSEFRGPPGMLVVSDQVPMEQVVYDSAQKQQSSGYSLNGSIVSISKVPWQAQIYFPRERMSLKPYQAAFAPLKQKKVPEWAMEHYCGGALIAPQWVLTAAHCLSKKDVEHGFKVRVGHDDMISGEGQNFAIEQVYPYPGFVNGTGADMALIKLVKRTGRPAIKLYNGVDPKAPRQITAYGWGRTLATGAAEASPFLLKVDLNVMDRETCARGKTYGWKIAPTILCAQSPPATKRKTCKGDSGGPVVDAVSKRLLAVVGGGSPSCSADGAPSFYIWLDPKKRQWIRTTTGLNL